MKKKIILPLVLVLLIMIPNFDSVAHGIVRNGAESSRESIKISENRKSSSTRNLGEDMQLYLHLDKKEVFVNESINLTVRVILKDLQDPNPQSKLIEIRKLKGNRLFKLVTALGYKKENEEMKTYRFLYTISWGDDSPRRIVPSNSKTVVLSHKFDSPGNYTVVVRVKDIETDKVLSAHENILVKSGTGDATVIDPDHFWAVIVGIADYKDNRADLPIFKGKLKVLYYSLLASKNWKRTHIKLLINREATKRNILNALKWLDEKTGRGDTVLFAFMGHGTEVPDRDGDEGVFDRYDEAICPYDTRIKLTGGVDPDSVITDDELREIFDDIERGPMDFKKGLEGMCLIFEACLSGDLVDKGALEKIDINKDEIIDEGEETTKFTRDFIEDLEEGHIGSLGSGLEGRKRVVIMSSIGETLSVALTGLGGPLTNTLSMAFYGYADDRDLDRWVSAEEAFRWARKTYFVSASAFIEGLSAQVFFSAFIPAYMEALADGLNESEAIKVGIQAGLAAVAEFLRMIAIQTILNEIMAKILTGHWIIPIPTIYDGYQGELRITKIGLFNLPTLPTTNLKDIQ